MKTYDWIQILAVVAVLVYSWWVAHKGKQKKNIQKTRNKGTKTTDSPRFDRKRNDMTQSYHSVDWSGENGAEWYADKGLEEDTYLAYQTVHSDDEEEGAERLPSEGVPMIADPADESQRSVGMSDSSVNPTTKSSSANPLPDLRTMVIASEILKPKYEEY